MRSDERMNIDERRKYLKLMAGRYMEAGRLERGRLLTENERGDGADGIITPSGAAAQFVPDGGSRGPGARQRWAAVPQCAGRADRRASSGLDTAGIPWGEPAAPDGTARGGTADPPVAVDGTQDTALCGDKKPAATPGAEASPQAEEEAARRDAAADRRQPTCLARGTRFTAVPGGCHR